MWGWRSIRIHQRNVLSQMCHLNNGEKDPEKRSGFLLSAFCFAPSRRHRARPRPACDAPHRSIIPPQRNCLP